MNSKENSHSGTYLDTAMASPSDNKCAKLHDLRPKLDLLNDHSAAHLVSTRRQQMEELRVALFDDFMQSVSSEDSRTPSRAVQSAVQSDPRTSATVNDDDESLS